MHILNPRIPIPAELQGALVFTSRRMNVQVFPSLEAIDALRLELSLLYVLHHRNKNQHHLQPFFKHLAILKRTLSRLLEHDDSEYIVQRLRTVVIPNCWEVFSRVIARGEFVTLGLVLCACLARVAFCVGGIEGRDGTDAVEVDDGLVNVEEEELGEVVGREMFKWDIDLGVEDGNDKEPITPIVPKADNAVLAAEITVENLIESVPMLKEEIRGIGERKRPAKKRKKAQGNEIDELFAQLG
jgi:hypothetical protein